MANISIVSELVDAVMRNVDLSVNTLVTGAIKVGGSSGTDLTKSILDSLISSGDASSLHNHNTLYYTKTLLNATGTGTAGSTLVGDDNNYFNFSNTAGTVKGALQAIDSVLANVNLAILNDGSRPMAASLDAGNFNIINVLDPVNPQDVATKNYVDSASSGANTSLSNLSAVEVNAPISTTDQSSNPTVVSPDLTLKTGDTYLAAPGKIILQPGIDQNDSSSGEINLGGYVKITGSQLDMNNNAFTNASLINITDISLVANYSPANAGTGGTALVGLGAKALNLLTEDIGSGVTTQGIIVKSGDGTGTVNSGDINIASGSSVNGTTGNVNIHSGTPTGSGTRGNISIQGNTSLVQATGDLTLRSTAGKVVIDSSAAIQVNNGIVPLSDGGMNIGTVGKTAGQIYLTNAIRRGNGNKVLSITSGMIYDASEVDSIDFINRVLRNSSGLDMLDWSGSVLDAKTHKITNVVDPTNPQDAATKAYVDASGGGGGLASDFVSSNSAFSPSQSFGGASALIYNVINAGATLWGTVDVPLGDTANWSTGLDFVTGSVIEPTSNQGTGSLDISTGYNYGIGSSGSIYLETGYCANPGPGGGQSGDLYMYTGDNGFNTGLVLVSSGNSSGGNSGDLTLATGTAALGTRGRVILNTDIVAFDNWTWTKNGAGHDFDPSFKFFGYDAPAANVLFGSGDVPNGNTTQASSVVGIATGSVLDATSTHNSGSLSIQSGAAYGSGKSGDLLMGTGYSETGLIGEVQIFTSVNGSNDRSGNITLVTGASGSNRGKVRLDGVFVETSSKFLPDTTDVIDLGSGAKRWGDLYANSFRGSAIVGNLMANSLTTPSGQSAAGLWGTTDFVIYTNNNGSANANPTNTLYLESGNKTAGTGNSGNIKLTTGTSAGGVRGNIVLDGLAIDATSKNIINVADPSSNQHAATKKYVDDSIGALAPGASTTLANLTSPTAVNQHLLPDASSNFRNLGSASQAWAELFTLEVDLVNTSGVDRMQVVSAISTPSGNTVPGVRATSDITATGLGLITQNDSGVHATGHIYVETGNSVDGNSGTINVRTGIPSGTGIRGKINLDALTVQLPKGTSDPTGVEGDVYYNTSTHKMMLYDGTSWVALN